MATSAPQGSPADLVRIGLTLMGLGALGSFYLVAFPPPYDPVYGTVDYGWYRELMLLALGTWLAGVALQFRAWSTAARSR